MFYSYNIIGFYTDSQKAMFDNCYRLLEAQTICDNYNCDFVPKKHYIKKFIMQIDEYKEYDYLEFYDWDKIAERKRLPIEKTEKGSIILPIYYYALVDLIKYSYTID